MLHDTLRQATKNRQARAVLLIAAFWMLSGGRPAFAQFPGTNGDLLYESNYNAGGLSAIYSTAYGQLTFPDQGWRDFAPAFSPDGKQIVFGSQSASGYSLWVATSRGTDPRLLVTRSEPIGSAAWSRDGRTIAFTVIQNPSGGIWLVNTDGTGMRQIVFNNSPFEQTAFDPEWSPTEPNKILYRCRYLPLIPSIVGQSLRDDFCIADITGGIQQMPIEWAAAVPNTRGLLSRPRWTPDGARILFTMTYNHPQTITWTSPNGFASGTAESYRRREVFSVKRDGTGVTLLTNSPYIVTNFAPYLRAQTEFMEAAMSPDGQQIATVAQRWFSHADVRFATLLLDKNALELSILRTATHHPRGLAWQPIPFALTFHVNDGIKGPLGDGPRPLRGLRLEIRSLDGTIVRSDPLNPVAGTYVFEDVPAAGEYVMRATLEHRAVNLSAASPVFNVHYTENATEPVWLEWRVTVSGPGQSSWCFCEENPELSAYTDDVPSTDGHRLDDLANLFARTQQFVEWVRAHVVEDTGAPVAIYAFATTEPGGNSPVLADDAFYYPGRNLITIGTASSDYANRDGVTDPGTSGTPQFDDDGPANVEWHEFTHHLYHQFINDRAGCRAGYVPHAGYNNPDTCDSLDEGFAMFLPALAASELEGAGGDYDTFGVNFNDFKYKPWGYKADVPGGFVYEPTDEDTSVAGLFWDLVDPTNDRELTFLIGANGQHRGVEYIDTTTLAMHALWSQMAQARPATVLDLRRMFGNHEGMTIDLDGDGLRDIASIDQVFLMHGFFPVIGDQFIDPVHRTYHYDVASGQRLNPGDPMRNSAVGRTDHYVYDSTGLVIFDTLSPRIKTPVDRGARIRVDVRDGAGTPVSGAVHTLTLATDGSGSGGTTGAGRYGGLSAELTIQYPGGHVRTISRALRSGNGALVHLELPPYFDFLLPEGGSLPPCNPTLDTTVQVTLSAVANGTERSSETPSFDNCTYQRAIATTATPPALSYALTIPSAAIPIAQVSAIPDPGSTFVGWSGPDAAECATGVVLMTTDKRCTATFAVDQFILTLATTGTGSGTVSGAGPYTSGQTATVQVSASFGSTFEGWSGPDATECATGSVLMTTNKVCTATFTLKAYTLSITTAGTGTGTVTGAGAYDHDEIASVDAVPDAGSELGSWSGINGAECATGSVVMTGDKSCTITFVRDVSAPFGSVRINDNAVATNTKAVVLTLTCTDPAGCSQMQFSNNGTKGWSKLQPFATTASWSLSNGDGNKAVYARFQDSLGNLSPFPTNDQILLDTAVPGGTLAINGNAAATKSGSVMLTAACNDGGSGCSQMQFSNDNVNWTTLEPYASPKSWTLASGDGVRTVYARYRDVAGNLSSVLSDVITLDTIAPSGSVSVAGGAAFTATTDMTLSLSCADGGGSGCSQVQLSNDGTMWSAAQPYASSVTWALLPEDGIKTISARFLDAAGNLSLSASASITLDTTAPSGTIVINNGDAATSARTVTLALSCTDAASGCSQMQFSATGTSGWSKLQPFAPSAVYNLSSGTGTKTVFVRFVDAVGNVSANASDSIVRQ